MYLKAMMTTKGHHRFLSLARCRRRVLVAIGLLVCSLCMCTSISTSASMSVHDERFLDREFARKRTESGTKDSHDHIVEQYIKSVLNRNKRQPKTRPKAKKSQNTMQRPIPETRTRRPAPKCALDKKGFFGTKKEDSDDEIIDFSYEVEIDPAKQAGEKLSNTIAKLEHEMANRLIPLLFRRCQSAMEDTNRGRRKKLLRNRRRTRMRQEDHLQALSSLPYDEIRVGGTCQDLFVSRRNFCVVVNGQITIYTARGKRYNKQIVLDHIEEMIVLKELTGPDSIVNIAFSKTEPNELSRDFSVQEKTNDITSAGSMVLAASLVGFILLCLVAVGICRRHKQRNADIKKFKSTNAAPVDEKKKDKQIGPELACESTTLPKSQSDSLSESASWDSDQAKDDMPRQIFIDSTGSDSLDSTEEDDLSWESVQPSHPMQASDLNPSNMYSNISDDDDDDDDDDDRRRKEQQQGSAEQISAAAIQEFNESLSWGTDLSSFGMPSDVAVRPYQTQLDRSQSHFSEVSWDN